MKQQHWEKNIVRVNDRQEMYCPHCHDKVYASKMTKAYIRLVRQQGFKQFKFSNRMWRCPKCQHRAYELK